MFWLFAEFDWLTYATLLPALPHHAVLPLLDCVTLEELDGYGYHPIHHRPRPVPYQSIHALFVTPFWACVLLRKACLANKALPASRQRLKPGLRLGLIYVSINDTSG